MPTVPRNTITETRIDRRPGVQSVTPRGAEGLGAIASAVGQQADLAGQKARVIGQQFDAIQDVFDQGNRMVVNVDRIQRIRDARQMDEAEIDWQQHMDTGTRGYDDPETGEHVQGAYETPFSPKDEQNEGSSAQQATAKLHAAWFEKNDGKYATLSPRAQDELKKRLTAKYRVYDKTAFDVDRRNDAIRRKEIDEAASSANYALMAQNAADTARWAETSEVAISSEAMRVSRHLMVVPDVATEADIKWRDPKFKAVYEQTKRDVRAKAALSRAYALLAMARAEPNDENATEYLSLATSFLDTYSAPGEKDPLLPPEARAKVNEEAQTIKKHREREAAALYNEAVRKAEDLSVNVGLGLQDSKELDAILPTLTETDRIKIQRSTERAVQIEDRYSARKAFAKWRIDGDQLSYFRKVDELRTEEGKAYARYLIQKPEADRIAAEDKIVASANRAAIMSCLTAGISIDPATGQMTPLSPYQIREAGITAFEDGIIDDGDFDKVMAAATPKDGPKAAEMAETAFRIAARELKVDESELKKWFAYKAQNRRFVMDDKLQANRFRRLKGRAEWTDMDGDQEVETIQAELIGEALNALIDYMHAPTITTKDQDGIAKSPLAPEEVLRDIFKPETNGTRRKLDEAVIRRNIGQRYNMTKAVYNNFAKRTATASMMNRYNRNKNATTTTAEDETQPEDE